MASTFWRRGYARTLQDCLPIAVWIQVDGGTVVFRTQAESASLLRDLEFQ